MRRIDKCHFVFALCGAVLCTVAVRADPIEDFYKGKTVSIVTSTGVGGAFDLTARALAKHMPRYIPGQPAMIVRNMPGGGHVLATNFMYTQAAKDGTVLATVNNSIPLHQVLDGRGVRFDAGKFNWLGSTGGSNLFTWAWHSAGEQAHDPAILHDPHLREATVRQEIERRAQIGVRGYGPGADTPFGVRRPR